MPEDFWVVETQKAELPKVFDERSGNYEPAEGREICAMFQQSYVASWYARHHVHPECLPTVRRARVTIEILEDGE